MRAETGAWPTKSFGSWTRSTSRPTSTSSLRSREIQKFEENRTTNKGQGIGSLTNEGLTQLLEIIQIGPDQSPCNRMAQKINRDRSTTSNAVPSNQKFNEERGQADYSSQAGRKWLEDVLLERIQKRLSTIPSHQQEGKSKTKVGIHVLALADFNEDTLNFNLPYEQPECINQQDSSQYPWR